MSARIRLSAGLLAALAVSACGSSHAIKALTATTRSVSPGHKLFSASGMALHFMFPASFTLRIARSKRVAGNTSQASQAAVGISRYDLLIVSRFPHRPIPVTPRNIGRLRPQFDAAVTSALGHKVTSSVVTLAGLPALAYPPTSVVGLPVKVTSRITDVFVADDEYELNCQYTPARAKEILAACYEMVTTLSASR